MSFVDVYAVDKETGDPASKDALEAYLKRFDPNLELPNGSDNRRNYAVLSGSVEAAYLKKQTAVTIYDGGEDGLAERIMDEEGPFNWHPLD